MNDYWSMSIQFLHKLSCYDNFTEYDFMREDLNRRNKAYQKRTTTCPWTKYYKWTSPMATCCCTVGLPHMKRFIYCAVGRPLMISFTALKVDILHEKKTNLINWTNDNFSVHKIKALKHSPATTKRLSGKLFAKIVKLIDVHLTLTERTFQCLSGTTYASLNLYFWTSHNGPTLFSFKYNWIIPYIHFSKWAR